MLKVLVFYLKKFNKDFIKLVRAKGKTPSPPTSHRGGEEGTPQCGGEASEMPCAFLLYLHCDGQRKIIRAKSTDLGNPSTSLDVYPNLETLKYLMYKS